MMVIVSVVAAERVSLSVETRPDELVREVAHQHGGVVLGETLDGFEQTVTTDHLALVVARIADASYDAEQIEPDHGFVVAKLLENPREQIRPSERLRDGRTETKELLKRLEEVLECVGLRSRETFDDRFGEAAVEEMFFDFGGLFLEPVRFVST